MTKPKSWPWDWNEFHKWKQSTNDLTEESIMNCFRKLALNTDATKIFVPWKGLWIEEPVSRTQDPYSPQTQL